MKIRNLSSSELRCRLRTGDLRWQVGPFVLCARTRLPDVAREIAFLYAHFPLVDTDAVIDAEIHIRSKDPLRWWVSVAVDGQVIYNWFRRHLALPLFEWALNQCLFQRPHQYLILHAAVVEKQGDAVVLPAPPGSGKSTLCAALVARGWRLLSDEVAMIQPWDRQLMPVPRPIGLKEESIGLIRRFAPQLPLGPAWPGTPKGALSHVQPSADSAQRAQQTARPCWLVFPTYQSQAPATLAPVSNSQALMRAAENSFNYSVLGRQGFETLANLVEDCGCYEFVYSDLAEAVERLEELRFSTVEPAESTIAQGAV